MDINKKIRQGFLIVVILLVLLLLFAHITLIIELKQIGAAEYVRSTFLPVEEKMHVKYGRSIFEDTQNDIRIGVERITTEIYYITYSWVSGNLTYNAVSLVVEQTEQRPLNVAESYQGCYAIDDNNNHYYPMFYQEAPYPPDDPLGYKNTLYVKFWPFDSQADTVTLYLSYAGYDYIFEDIPIR